MKEETFHPRRLNISRYLIRYFQRMKRPAFQEYAVQLIACLYIMLFVYASLTKLADYETFVAQVSQSPMLTPIAAVVAWAVPLLELLIVLALVFVRTRLTGLYAACGLMTAFTMYIVVITNYSYYVPCSCGGVLEQMTWRQHLVFNLIFVVAGMAGVLLHTRKLSITSAMPEHK